MIVLALKGTFFFLAVEAQIYYYVNEIHLIQTAVFSQSIDN